MNQNGFVVIWMVFFLPLLLSLFFVVQLILSFLNIDQKLRHTCHQNHILAQQLVATDIYRLFALNPQAIKYQMERLKILAAMTNPHPANLAYQGYRLTRLKSLQYKLQKKQLKIINQANKKMLSAQKQLYNRLWLETSKISTDWLPWLIINIELQRPLPKKIAVEPIIPDLGPPYQTKKRFIELQTLEQKWKIRLFSQTKWRKFFNTRLQWEVQCRVSIKQNGLLFQPVINEF